MSLVKSKYGGTTWIQHSGYMLRGASSGVTTNSATATGGEDTHILTINEIPSHYHVFDSQSGNYPSSDFTNEGLMRSATSNYQSTFATSTVGGGDAHNNLPKYKSVYIWERTA